MCEYQNFFLQKKYGLEFWHEKPIQTEAIFNNETYMENQVSQSATELDVNKINPEKLEEL